MNMNCISSTPAGMVAAMMSISFEESSYDASSFPPASMASSYGSFSSQESASSCMSKVGGLSRSRCMSNLSALGGSASETSIPRQANYKSGPNQWGYFVDTPST
mmetsp:Transcript_8532/g.17226  ORF Transcript_8532/g.17226 Transcript_8532/m.17226 type:complete len:104 (+) Transcript_8532:63-374(+)|eukprot:CAMPEP_0113398204 /NCGR_PEP_ID=MMETSP0013_2-20120614/14820_1 /TAXON_ID=2843 ORGANISM="Skeletonema costatum, Strain 1716" /NCGR_SAMPLE_ID=MMETSP0013_2 /ASSEMBLY_ACC=CAM_ASM_000158 /LENGTH=103 /DNA_ID=CAMNT_0000282901 /DNA_START=41 /DNA_END=352 /DNA_ORIENTATION=+ /assembly_acc=CAM_ASM_000158